MFTWFSKAAGYGQNITASSGALFLNATVTMSELAGEIYQIIRPAIGAEDVFSTELHCNDTIAGPTFQDVLLEMDRTAVDNQTFSFLPTQ